MGRLYSFSHNKAKSLRMFPEKANQSKKILRKAKSSYIKHYIKVWKLMFDVYKSHVEKEEFLIKVGSFLFSNQNCIRKVKVRHSACLVR